MSDSEKTLSDQVQPFLIEDLGLRGRLVRLGRSVDEIAGRGRYPAPVAELLAEFLAFTVVLGNALKFEGIFKAQAQGDGPVGFLVADMTHDGNLRGYARFDAGHVEAIGDVDSAPVPRLLGAGRLAVTVDQGPSRQQYQGITELTGASLSDCAHAYFRQSEPVETAISLAAGLNGQTVHASALMIQRVAHDGGQPGSEEDEHERDYDDEWRRAVVLTSSVTPTELLNPALESSSLLYRLYHEDGVRLFRVRDIRHSCRCSQERVAATLSSFPSEEIDSMVEDGRITVTCGVLPVQVFFRGEVPYCSLPILMGARTRAKLPRL
ncbi:MAG: Hsp33 family molecular chaperone HslO [Rhodospirillales bacterium]|nr:Hsp33 family molecular chaperone HslO [Rhodospirillales bacterium]